MLIRVSASVCVSMSMPLSPRHAKEHCVEEALLLAALWVESREGVGEAQEVRAALLLGHKERAQRVAAAAGLKKHGGVDAVERGGLAARGQALVRDSDRRSLSAALPTSADRRGRAGLHVGEEHSLECIGRCR